MTTTLRAKAAVMGWPISHSLSPRLHGFWLKKYNIDGHYGAIAIEPQNLQTALRDLPTQNLCGVNLTLPHKEAACGIVDTLDEVAQRIGAVNLVVVGDNGTLHGHNTDAYGFTQNLLSAGFKPEDGKALILGAGGGARAVIVALAAMGFTHIDVVNRTDARAEKLVQEFFTPSCRVMPVAWQDAPQALDGASLVVNTTTLGMHGQPELVFPLDRLSPAATVTDIVYTPLETGLLRAARLRGNAAIDGLGMLLHQARPAFAAFFGRDPEVTSELRDFVLAGK